MRNELACAWRWRFVAVLNCTGGASAAEFAMVLPLLLLILMGTVQMSMMMYSYNVMVSTARDTARAMAVCTILDEPKAISQARHNQPAWLTDEDWKVTPVIGSDVSLKIEVSAAKAAILNYLPVDFGTLTTKVTMRKEPLAFGGGAC